MDTTWSMSTQNSAIQLPKQNLWVNHAYSIYRNHPNIAADGFVSANRWINQVDLPDFGWTYTDQTGLCTRFRNQVKSL